MRSRLITPPEPAVTVEHVKVNSRITDGSEDDLILGFIKAAGARAEKECGRAFGPQTWETVLDAFPASRVDLPIGPVASITSITYLDVSGQPTVLPADGVWEFEELSSPGTVHLIGAWPTTSASRSAVVVRYVAGDGWPEEVKQAVLLMVGHWYHQRETASAEAMREVPYGAASLLSLHRRMFA